MMAHHAPTSHRSYLQHSVMDSVSQALEYLLHNPQPNPVRAVAEFMYLNNPKTIVHAEGGGNVRVLRSQGENGPHRCPDPNVAVYGSTYLSPSELKAFLQKLQEQSGVRALTFLVIDTAKAYCRREDGSIIVYKENVPVPPESLLEMRSYERVLQDVCEDLVMAHQVITSRMEDFGLPSWSLYEEVVGAMDGYETVFGAEGAHAAVVFSSTTVDRLVFGMSILSSFRLVRSHILEKRRNDRQRLECIVSEMQRRAGARQKLIPEEVLRERRIQRDQQRLTKLRNRTPEELSVETEEQRILRTQRDQAREVRRKREDEMRVAVELATIDRMARKLMAKIMGKRIRLQRENSCLTNRAIRGCLSDAALDRRYRQGVFTIQSLMQEHLLSIGGSLFLPYTKPLSRTYWRLSTKVIPAADGCDVDSEEEVWEHDKEITLSGIADDSMQPISLATKALNLCASSFPGKESDVEFMYHAVQRYYEVAGIQRVGMINMERHAQLSMYIAFLCQHLKSKIPKEEDTEMQKALSKIWLSGAAKGSSNDKTERNGGEDDESISSQFKKWRYTHYGTVQRWLDYAPLIQQTHDTRCKRPKPTVATKTMLKDRVLLGPATLTDPEKATDVPKISTPRRIHDLIPVYIVDSPIHTMQTIDVTNKLLDEESYVVWMETQSDPIVYVGGDRMTVPFRGVAMKGEGLPEGGISNHVIRTIDRASLCEENDAKRRKERMERKRRTTKKADVSNEFGSSNSMKPELFSMEKHSSMFDTTLANMKDSLCPTSFQILWSDVEKKIAAEIEKGVVEDRDGVLVWYHLPDAARGPNDLKRCEKRICSPLTLNVPSTAATTSLAPPSGNHVQAIPGIELPKASKASHRLSKASSDDRKSQSNSETRKSTTITSQTQAQELDGVVKTPAEHFLYVLKAIQDRTDGSPIDRVMYVRVPFLISSGVQFFSYLDDWTRRINKTFVVKSLDTALVISSPGVPPCESLVDVPAVIANQRDVAVFTAVAATMMLFHNNPAMYDQISRATWPQRYVKVVRPDSPPEEENEETDKADDDSIKDAIGVTSISAIEEEGEDEEEYDEDNGSVMDIPDDASLNGTQTNAHHSRSPRLSLAPKIASALNHRDFGRVNDVVAMSQHMLKQLLSPKPRTPTPPPPPPSPYPIVCRMVQIFPTHGLAALKLLNEVYEIAALSNGIEDAMKAAETAPVENNMRQRWVQIAFRRMELYLILFLLSVRLGSGVSMEKLVLDNSRVLEEIEGLDPWEGTGRSCPIPNHHKFTSSIVRWRTVVFTSVIS
eukprot:PhF_6_TR25538/c0_g1_i1/m.35820